MSNVSKQCRTREFGAETLTRISCFVLSVRTILSWPRPGDKILIAAIGLIITAETFALSQFKVDASGRFLGILANLELFAATWFFVTSAMFLFRLTKVRPPSPIGFAVETYFGPRQRKFLRSGLPVVLALGMFLPIFSAMKSAIPLFNPYTWDSTFIALDRSIHGGDAWRWMQPMIGYPLVSSIISLFYHTWIMLLYGVSLWVALYLQNARLRFQYLLTFVASWTFIGVVLAIAFASVGPCFVGPILGDPTFNDQMAYLNEANRSYPVLVLEVQNTLLAWHRSGDHGLGRGITAMPSMHLSIAMLSWLLARRIDKRLGWAAMAFLIIIMIGSVHLGYHYAVDGYAAIILTAMIWWLAGKIANRLPSLIPPPAPPVQQV